LRDHYDALIVGAGHGGANAALALRQRKFTGSIALVSDESSLPYERPPLSKDYLTGKRGFEQILLRSQPVWESHGIDLLLGERAVEVNAQAHALTLESRRTLTYGNLIWAAGGRARRLSCPGNDLAGVHAIRTREDVDRLREEVRSATRIAIIGAGYVGLEAAASLTSLGKQVCLIEAQSRVLARVAGPEVSAFYAREHQARGVEVLVDRAVDGLEGANGRVARVVLKDEPAIDAEVVIIGVGMLPTVEVLGAAGAEVANGVRVDAQCRTTLPDVYAIGDCAWHPNRFAAAGFTRLESVQNAVGQAATVARVLAGESAEYTEVPWFWSEQFDLRLQTVGLSGGFDQTVVRGNPADRTFSVVYLRDGRVLALDCINAARDFMPGKHLVAGAARVDLMQLADASVELRSLKG
jgi:3-phenylpropionate/trans-cinnamate dioxygenase ferredoxin reductase component